MRTIDRPTGYRQTWIALLRGINVGGRNILPMKDLRQLCDELGFQTPRTYIQSGNCVFDSDATGAQVLAGEVASAIGTRFGFHPQVMVLSKQDLQAAIAANPWPEGMESPKTVHLYFPGGPFTDVDLPALDRLRAPDESVFLSDGAFYLHTPRGIGGSRLAAQVERHLHVPVTARNLRTVMRLADLAGNAGPAAI